MSGRLAGRLVRLYPRRWRDRYGEELEALLEDRGVSVTDALDIALGALDAWLHPGLVEGAISAAARMRAASIAILSAWAAFVIAGVGFQKATEDAPFTTLAREHAAIGIPYHVLQGGAAVALLAMLAGGVPVAYCALRRALSEGRRDVPLLLCVPPVSLAAFIGYALLLTRIVYPAIGPVPVHSPINVALFLSLAGVFLLAAASSVVAVSVVAMRGGAGERALRFALIPGVFAAAAMAVMLAAVVAWGIGVLVEDPRTYAGGGGVLDTNFALSFLVVVAVMIVSTLVAGASALRGLSARREELSG